MPMCSTLSSGNNEPIWPNGNAEVGVVPVPAVVGEVPQLHRDEWAVAVEVRTGFPAASPRSAATTRRRASASTAAPSPQSASVRRAPGGSARSRQRRPGQRLTRCIMVEPPTARAGLGKAMRDSEDGMAARRPFPLPELSVALWTALLAGLTILGSDLMWVVAMGDVIRDTGAVPHGIPFASAPQADWHNPIAVAQVLLSLVHAAGPLGLAALHLVVVAATLSVVVAESRRLGGGDVRTAVVVALVVVGCATAFAVARLPDLSLLPFVGGRGDHAPPARRALARGVVARAALRAVGQPARWGARRAWRCSGSSSSPPAVAARWCERALVGVAAALSLLATSAGLGTPAYYVGVLTNEAAARGSRPVGGARPRQPPRPRHARSRPRCCWRCACDAGCRCGSGWPRPGWSSPC